MYTIQQQSEVLSEKPGKYKKVISCDNDPWESFESIKHFQTAE